MKIAYDGSALRPPMSGVGYYTYHLLSHLLAETGRNEFVVVSNRPDEMAHYCPPGVAIWRRHQFRIRALWMQLLAPAVMRSLNAELAHFTNSVSPILSKTPVIVTVHDMTLRLLPGFHPWQRKLTLPLIEWSTKRARAVIAVSHSAKRDIVDLMGIPEERVRVIYEAPAPAFRRIGDGWLLEKVRRHYDLPARFLLTVGTIEPRKNLNRILSVFSRLKKKGLQHKLVLAGGRGWGYKAVSNQIRHLSLEDEVLLPGYVPFEWLPALYTLSEVFLFPSLYEGFGLPVVEAMACGVPVITSGSSALGEIAGEAALLVDSYSEESLEEAIRTLCSDSDLRAEFGRKGLERAAHFSWSKTARETLTLYRQIASEAGTRD